MLLNILRNVKPARQIKKSNCKEPLSPHPIVDRPWEKIATDFFYCNGSDWLVVIDFYSNWIELAKMRSKNISAVKEILLKMFTRNGIPDIIFNDVLFIVTRLKILQKNVVFLLKLRS